MPETSTAESTLPRWGDELVTELVAGTPTRVYRERPRSLVALLDEASRWRDRVYLLDEHRKLTFAGFRSAVEQAARTLAAEGVGAGDRVMLLARNSIEWIIGFWAIARLGAIAVLGNAWWSEAEVGAACDVIGPQLVIADPPRAARVHPAHRLLAIERLVADPGDEDVSSPQRPSEDDPALIVFTSGTTGAPKGAVLSHRSVIANQHNFLARTHRLPSNASPDRPVVTSLLSTPLFHTGGIQAFMTALLTGGRLVFLAGRFEPERVLDLIERERVTVWAGVPTMLQRVLDHDGINRRDLSSVRAIGVGGAPLPAALIRRAATAFPNAGRGVSTNYGSTEAGGIVSTASGSDVLDHPGTSGRPLPAVEVRIESPAPDEPGEVLVRSAAVFSGYWGESSPAVDEHGWLHTGDIGRLDEDGFLYIVDRLKDVVIRGGENIASAHVELALLEHPSVAAVAVVGLPHRDLGEELAAVIVARDATAPRAEELRRHAATRLAHFEVPTRWWIRREALPLNATGKVDKRALRAAWPAAPGSAPAA